MPPPVHTHKTYAPPSPASGMCPGVCTCTSSPGVHSRPSSPFPPLPTSNLPGAAPALGAPAGWSHSSWGGGWHGGAGQDAHRALLGGLGATTQAPGCRSRRQALSCGAMAVRPCRPSLSGGHVCAEHVAILRGEEWLPAGRHAALCRPRSRRVRRGRRGSRCPHTRLGPHEKGTGRRRRARAGVCLRCREPVVTSRIVS